jgi:hypothetical protein
VNVNVIVNVNVSVSRADPEGLRSEISKFENSISSKNIAINF